MPTQRTYARFYVLETIARVPYFSFLSALHLWETVGWWRRADYLKVHFAQTFNELHHLLIMESLGGADRYADRFLAQHAALAYYVYVLAVYLVSPRMAYNFQEQVEEHAFATYDAFLRTASAPQFYDVVRLYGESTRPEIRSCARQKSLTSQIIEALFLFCISKPLKIKVVLIL